MSTKMTSKPANIPMPEAAAPAAATGSSKLKASSKERSYPRLKNK
jgi:hypothetical protein